MTPEQFLADYPPQIQELAQALRALVKQVVPDTSESVYRGWQLIGYRVARQKPASGKGGAYFCFIAPTADQLQLGFEYGVLLGDPRRLLDGGGKQVRYVTVTSPRDIEREGMKELVAEAARVALLPKDDKIALRMELDQLREQDHPEG